MKLIAIELENFRQYRGRQRVTFAQGAGHNVSVFYGTNGSGKTTLLNAFTWALYEHLSEDVEEQGRLITDCVWEAAPPGSQVTASVTVEFEHDGSVYGARRYVTAEKQTVEQRLPRPGLTMWRRGPDGITKDVASPSSQVDRILPERLSRFFFVNGERIEHLVRKDAYAQIQDAIKTLLGLEQLERAVNHLPQAAQKLRRQLKSDGGENSTIQHLTDEIDDIDRETAANARRREELRAEEQHLKDEIDVVNNKLHALAGARELQQRREQLEDQLAKTVALRSEHDEQRQKLLRTEGYLAFLNGLPARVLAAADQLRERGELPAPIKRTFIDDLLAKGQCICGSDVSEGATGRSELERWRARAGLAEVEAAWNTLRGAAGTLDERRQSVLEALTAADVAVAEAADEERRLQEEINEVSVLLKKMPLEEIGALESRREELMQNLTETSQEFGAVKSMLTRLAAERSQKESAIEHLQVKGAANERIQHRIAVVKEVKAALDEILQAASEGTRRRLESRIRQLFIPISLKRYEPRLTPDFQLEYWQRMAGQEIPAPKSTGENMLLSLSFVAAVAAECRAVAESQNPLFAGVGGEFPVVMDAAFGNLDDDYRRQIANFLPDLTSQVVVLTSKAQSAGVVDEQLAPRIGKQYIITTYTTRRDLQDVTEQIALSGRSYPYQVTGSDWDGAEFTEVRP